MSTLKTISLDISERLAALAILNTFKGGLDKLAVILEDIKQFSITDEEWVKAERKIEATPSKEDPNASQWSWSNEKGGNKDIVLQEGTAEYLKQVIKERDEKGELSLSDKSLVTLNQKLT